MLCIFACGAVFMVRGLSGVLLCRIATCAVVDLPCSPNWHDIAGATVYNGTYHVFQGCNAFGGQPAGWHHAISTNLVRSLVCGRVPCACSYATVGVGYG